MSDRATGSALALVSAVCFGMVPLLGQVVYDAGADAATTLAVRFALAGAVLLALARLRRETRPPQRAVLALVLLGSVGYGLQSLAYFTALERLSAGLTALLLYAYPTVVVLLVAVTTRRRPRPLAVLATAVATAGVALSVGPLEGGQALGVLLGLSSALAYGVLCVVSPPVLRLVGPFTGTGVICLGSAAFDGVVVAALGPQAPAGLGGWSALVAIGLLGGVVGITALFAALVRLAPSEVGVLSTLEPVVAVVGGAALLDEGLRPVQVAGGVLVLLAVLVLVRSREVAATPA